jgi:hypothetical protein
MTAIVARTLPADRAKADPPADPPAVLAAPAALPVEIATPAPIRAIKAP